MDIALNRNNQHCEAMLQGEFVFSDNHKFKKDVLRLLDEGIVSLTLNFQGVTFVDSAALGMLLLLRDKASQRHITLTLNNPQGQVRKVFDISRFDQLFKIA